MANVILNKGANTVKWTATDACGKTSTCTIIVNVSDIQPPNAICKPVTVTLVGGSATISVANVNNGSTDNCGIATMVLSKTSFDCTNIGANNVTLTVTDVNGNVSTCIAVVTVNGTIPTCSITAIPAKIHIQVECLRIFTGAMDHKV